MADVPIDQIIGGGGLGVGGWIALILYNAYKQWARESKTREKVLDSQLQELREVSKHREKEERYWSEVAKHSAREEEHLRGLREDIREVRQRLPSGPHSVVPISDSRPIDVGR